MSATEAGANIGVGYLVSLALTFAVLPLFGYAVTVPDAFGISAVFTLASLVRSYVLRRWFNGVRA